MNFSSLQDCFTCLLVNKTQTKQETNKNKNQHKQQIETKIENKQESTITTFKLKKRQKGKKNICKSYFFSFIEKNIWNRRRERKNDQTLTLAKLFSTIS